MTPEELKAKRYRMEECVLCGKEWNVSRRARIPKSGYVCPHCRSRRDIKKTAASAATVLGLMLYGVMCWLAYTERGYVAFGGECFFLLFPLWGIGMHLSLLGELMIGRIKRQCRPLGRRTALWTSKYRTGTHSKGCTDDRTISLYHENAPMSTGRMEHDTHR